MQFMETELFIYVIIFAETCELSQPSHFDFWETHLPSLPAHAAELSCDGQKPNSSKFSLSVNM